MAATTPKEHVEFLIAAMDPARANDVSSVVKVCLQIVHGCCTSFCPIVGFACTVAVVAAR